MTRKTILSLIELNNSFYRKVGKDFDRTRQVAWKGWDLIWEYLKSYKPSSILDIGCGNGRFYYYIQDKLLDFKYVGLDSDIELVNKAKWKAEAIAKARRNREKNVKWIVRDALGDLSGLGSFDLVVAFGLMHHIPSNDLRSKFFKQVVELLNPTGLIVFSHWKFAYKANLLSKVSAKFMKKYEKRLDSGDYILNWNKDENLARYCHDYSVDETLSLISSSGLNHQSSFCSLDKGDKFNEYWIVSRDH